MTSSPVCSLWWLLAAALAGWLLAGWFMRQYLPRVMSDASALDRLAERDSEIARLRAALAERAAPVARSATVKAAPAATEPAAAATPPEPSESPALPAARTAAAAPEPAAVTPPFVDREAARAASFDVAGIDDLEVIEGIGPKITGLLKEAQVASFAQLAATTPAAIRAILDAAGPGFRVADPQTWPEQAALAAANRWSDLKSLQDSLTAGRRT